MTNTVDIHLTINFTEDDQTLQELNIASEKLTILKRIGEGTFGIVMKANLTGKILDEFPHICASTYNFWGCTGK